MYRLWIMSLLMAASGFAADHCVLNQEVADKVAENTYKIVPINLFAGHMSVEQARNRFKEECVEPGKLLSTSESLNCEIFKTCQGPFDCVATYAGHGSASVIDNGNTLITAWHVTFGSHASPLYFLANAFDHHSTEEKQKILADALYPEFILLNQKGEKVYDSREEQEGATKYALWGDPISTAHMHFGKKKNKTYGYFENIPDDFVYIELARPIGEGLETKKVDKSNIKSEECLYSVGFAYDSKTEHFKVSAGKHSTIKNLKQKLKLMPFMINPLPVSVDEFQQLERLEKMKMMGFSVESSKKQIEKYGLEVIDNSIATIFHAHLRHQRDLILSNHEQALFFDAPVMFGQSGGPIVNQQGQVIGITTNGFINDDHVSVGGAGVFLQR